MRFSLITLFVFTATVAAICGVMFAMDANVAIVVMGVGLLWMGAVNVAGVIYCRGYVRAFFIGCLSSSGWIPLVSILFLPAAGPMLYMLFAGDESSEESQTGTKIMFAAIYLVAIIGGGIAVVVRWMALRREQQRTAKSFQSLTINLQPENFADLYAVLQSRIKRTEPIAAANDGE